MSLLMFFVANIVMATPRSVQQAKQEVLQLMNEQTTHFARGQQPGTIIEPQLVFSKTKKNAAEGAYYYVFSAGKDLGFTIVSGDDRLPAIIGYTKSGNYDADNLPANFVSFMQAYQNYVDHASDTELKKVNNWKAMAAIHEDVTPFVQAKWNQYEPYNNMCPSYDGINKSVTGCVATAIAQVLHYYKYPIVLQTGIPAYVTFSYGLPMDAINAGEIYDWDNMLDIYTGEETEEQNNAVAKLMLHVGCAMSMDYGYTSSAITYAEPLIKYFGMDKETTRNISRSSYDLTEWDDILYKEMAAGRPVVYDGQSTGGGHAFVIHGYSGGLYAVNWGWGGMCDGYFDITILNPNNTTGAGASSSEDGYSMGNGMIIGIQPDNGVVDVIDAPVFTSLSNIELSEASIDSTTLSGLVRFTPQNANLTEGSAYFCIGYEADNGGYTNVTSPYKCSFDELSIGFFYPDFTIPFSFQFEEAKTYRLCMIESRDSINWTPSGNAKATALLMQVRDGKIETIAEKPILSAMAELDQENSGGYAGMTNTINITVTNTGNKEYYDVVYVRICDTDSIPDTNWFVTGITAPVGGSTTFNFAFTPDSAGVQNFWILDASQNVLGKSCIEFLPTTAPKLSLVSVICDNVSGDKVITDYMGSSVEMNKVYDTKASFTFEIKNEGGYYQGPFIVYDKPDISGGWSGGWQMLTIPADTTVTFTFNVEGNIGEIVGVMLNAIEVPMEYLPNDKKNIHYFYEDGVPNGYYFSFSDAEIAYLAGSIPTAIGSAQTAETSLGIASGKGVIMLKATTDTNVRIVNIRGTEVAHIALNAGEQTIVSVPTGIYIVNQTKVIVR